MEVVTGGGGEREREGVEVGGVRGMRAVKWVRGNRVGEKGEGEGNGSGNRPKERGRGVGGWG